MAVTNREDRADELRQRLAHLTPAQRALLLEKARTQQLLAAGAAQQTPITPVARDQSLPLSFAQQRLWFLDQLTENRSIYNISTAVRLTGVLDTVALERSFAEIIRRHEALRTTFPQQGGAAQQVIAALSDFVLVQDDLSREQNPWAAGLRCATAEAQQSFNLATGPLLRATLLRLAPTDHLLLLTMHHIISDCWSLGILVRELSALYVASTTGQPSPLPPLPIQYADFASWQHAWLSGEEKEGQLDYWRQHLAGAPALLELPTDRPRPAVQTFAGAEHVVMVGQPLRTKLTALSERTGTTLFMTLLSAFSILLARNSGQDDIVVGTVVANRTRIEIESLIGFFVNTLVLRNNLAGNPTFVELLHRVRDTTVAAYNHQDTPFDLLVEALQPKRNLSHNPLFQVMLVLQNAHAVSAGRILPDAHAGPLQTATIDVATNSAKFDLTLLLEEGDDGLKCVWEYNTDLFDAATVARMATHFQILLEGIVADPEQRIAHLPILSDAERHQLLVEWNDTAADYPSDRCIHQLFEAQVERTPNAVAVIFEDQQLTYAELNARANQLAYHLQTLGVGPDVLVGICCERSLEMVIGLLGILKAGGAYVPLDPSYPAERLAFMLDDAAVPVLLTQAHLRPSLPPTAAQVVCLDRECPTIAAQPETTPASGVQPQHLAYMIYTSGSTGRPKGAMNEHRGVVNRLWWMQDTYHLQPDDRVLQKTPFSFDVSVWEFFWPLFTGAPLVVARPKGHGDPAYLATLIQAHQITTLHFVPSMLDAFVAADVLPACPSLRRVICSGEALADGLQQRFFAQSQAELHNLYGPTEAAVDVSFWPCQRERSHPVVPIGRPVANTQLYVLDARLQPMPIGVAGDLYIGGVQVGRGYRNRPELTTERFIANPFGAGQLYRTGDLARWLPDGNLEYLGRMDFQVKLRGFRIELGEIEALLSQQPLVQQAVVVVNKHGDDQRLVAYVVTQAPHPSSGELRDYLAEKLPSYMVPSAFIALPTMPLTPNGKIDRTALSSLSAQPSESQHTYVPPTTPTEISLAALWATLLGVERVGIQDDFFDLGGHSLLATQLISRVRTMFGVEVPLRRLFESPTVARFAAYLDLQTPVPVQEQPSIPRLAREAYRRSRNDS